MLDSALSLSLALSHECFIRMAFRFVISSLGNCTVHDVWKTISAKQQWILHLNAMLLIHFDVQMCYKTWFMWASLLARTYIVPHTPYTPYTHTHTFRVVDKWHQLCHDVSTIYSMKHRNLHKTHTHTQWQRQTAATAIDSRKIILFIAHGKHDII